LVRLITIWKTLAQLRLTLKKVHPGDRTNAG
jgi:hypothetical protein